MKLRIFKKIKTVIFSIPYSIGNGSTFHIFPMYIITGKIKTLCNLTKTGERH